MKTLILSFIKKYWLHIFVFFLFMFLSGIAGWNCHKKLYPCLRVLPKRDTIIRKQIDIKTDSIKLLKSDIEAEREKTFQSEANRNAEKNYYIKLINEYKKQSVIDSKKRIVKRYINLQNDVSNDSINKLYNDSLVIKKGDTELAERDMYKSLNDTCEKINLYNKKQIDLLNKSIVMYQDVTRLQLEQIWKLESTPININANNKWYEKPLYIIGGAVIGYGIRAIHKK